MTDVDRDFPYESKESSNCCYFPIMRLPHDSRMIVFFFHPIKCFNFLLYICFCHVASVTTYFSVMASKSTWPKTEKDFVKWFWDGTNGNNLIKKLNNASPSGDRIRREKNAPHIYGVVLNQGTFPFQFQRKQWKLCKIGFTQCTTTQGENNRMEQVEREVKKTRDASILFVLRISAVDTSRYQETEKRIRDKVGKRLCIKKANELKLPNPTEWVLTTQKHIDLIKGQINLIKEKKEGDVIDFFKHIPDPPPPPEKHRGEWFE